MIFKCSLLVLFILTPFMAAADALDGFSRISGADCAIAQKNSSFQSLVIRVSENKAKIFVYNGPRNAVDTTKGLALIGDGIAYSMVGFPNSSSETVSIKLNQNLQNLLGRPHLVLSAKIYKADAELPSSGYLSNPMTEDDDFRLKCTMYFSPTSQDYFVNDSGYVERTSHPSICAIEFINPLTGLWTHGCTASVVGANKLLTAGHCHDSFADKKLRVRCGEDTTWRTVLRWVPNPDFQNHSNPHDISVITLDSVGTAPALPMAKNTEDIERMILENRNCRHYGMGNRQDKSVGQLYTSPYRFPPEVLGGKDYVVRIFAMTRMILSDPTYFVRSGDSGGPLVCQNDQGQDVIVGVHSFISSASSSAKSAMTSRSWEFIQSTLKN